tara:strand:+ start:526 stop:834 length:309 start_codon:yes stop_codon:yes gene_type:complete
LGIESSSHKTNPEVDAPPPRGVLLPITFAPPLIKDDDDKKRVGGSSSVVVVVLVSTRTSANDSTTHDSTLHDGFFVGDFWCAKEDTIMSFVARAKASRCVHF